MWNGYIKKISKGAEFRNLSGVLITVLTCLPLLYHNFELFAFLTVRLNKILYSTIPSLRRLQYLHLTFIADIKKREIRMYVNYAYAYNMRIKTVCDLEIIFTEVETLKNNNNNNNNNNRVHCSY
jgi:hypothetical protein